MLHGINTLNLVKIGNSKGFCIPSKILKELGSAEMFTIELHKETGTLEIKPVESLMEKWIHNFYKNGTDGIVENTPVAVLTDTLIEDLEFQPNFDMEEKETCQKKSNRQNKGKSSK